MSLRFLNQADLLIGEADISQAVTPVSRLILEESNLAIVKRIAAEATSVVLQLREPHGRLIGNLAQAQISSQ